MSTGGNQFGSGGAYQPTSFASQGRPFNQTPAYAGAQDFVNQQLYRMPRNFNAPAGQFGRTGGGMGYAGPNPGPVGGPGNAGPFTGAPPMYPGIPRTSFPTIPGNPPPPPPGTGGMHAYQPEVPSFDAPPDTGGMTPQDGFINPGMNKPAMMPNETGGMHAYQQPAPSFGVPEQNQAMLQNTQNVANFQNPWGFSQAQMGKSFNPVGSPKGGYFDNSMNYVPNAGNARNGMDRLARAGMTYTGMPAVQGLFIR